MHAVRKPWFFELDLAEELDERCEREARSALTLKAKVASDFRVLVDRQTTRGFGSVFGYSRHPPAAISSLDP